MTTDIAVVLAVHDPVLRARLRRLLESEPPGRTIVECSSGAHAVDALWEHPQSVAVLEMQMPDVDGFAMVERVGADAMPAVVFTTRLHRPTLQALELHGLNYVLEPFEDEQFLATFRRALGQSGPRALAGVRRRLSRLLAGDEAGSRERRIAVRSAGKPHFVELDDVRWVEGAGAFSRLHLDDGTHVVKATLDELAERFPDGFLRIHSTLVRTSEVAEIQRTDEGDALVTLRDGRHLRVGRESGPQVVHPS